MMLNIEVAKTTTMEAGEKIYQVALGQIKGVGYVLANKLMASFGSAQAIFQGSKQELSRTLKGYPQVIKTILSQDTVEQARELLVVNEKAGIRIVTAWDSDYPERLKYTYGAPTLLYLKGNVDLNYAKVISIVGTRKATSYGKRVIETLLHEFSTFPLLVVSGLAYGIDIHAHRVALELGIPTLGVVAGGVDVIYPNDHNKTALAMLEQGGVLSEHPCKTKPEVYQFAARNRIIAGLADATIVVEAGEKSGALITANYANEYNREVFAVAGSIYESYSTGCHQLVKTHQANLLTASVDIIDALNWNQEAMEVKNPTEVIKRFPKLTAVEKDAVQTMGDLQEEVHIDELSYRTQIPLSQLASTLLQLELKNIVRFLPGNKIRFAC